MSIGNFAVEISIPLIVGLLASLYLKSVTTRLLADLCGTQDRSEFWVRITNILIVAVPLMFVLIFGRSGDPTAAAGDVARHALTLTLVGIVVSVGFLARAVFKGIPKPPTQTVVQINAKGVPQ